MSVFYFSVEQIARMAMDVEIAGSKFYASLAQRVHQKELKDVFITLSKAEIEHRESFLKIAQNFKESELNEYSIDIEAEIQRHLMMLKENAFNENSLDEKQMNVSQAIDVAINVEKMSVDIYTKVSAFVIEKFGDILRLIIQEEKKHLDMLLEIKRKI